mgnify:CR=1 FL=1
MAAEIPVLLVDDDVFVCRVVEDLLGQHGFSVEIAGSAAEAARKIRNGFQGPIVLDRMLPDADGTELLPSLLEICPTNPVVLFTGYGSVDLAINSIQTGAFEFLDKGELMERLVPCVKAAAERFLEQVRVSRHLESGEVRTSFREIITQSREMQAVFRTLRNALNSSVTVLIQGESGTGKELVARAIHDYGLRTEQPFLALNCAGIPENLLEAEIFGYERGAFSGATARKPGKFEVASDGTLLLDEIGEMHPSLQAKLLRVIQSGEYQRLGGVETLHANVRVLSATNRDLEREIELGRFRRDLFYRLAVFTVYLPPLRERKGDVAILAEHFLRQNARRESKPVSRFDRNALLLLESYHFPGNIRELENIISYAVISSRGDTLTIADFPPNFLCAVSEYRKASKSGRSAYFALPEPPVVYLPERDEFSLESSGSIPAEEGAAEPHGSGVVGAKSSPLDASVRRVTGEAGFPSLRSVEMRHIEHAMQRAGGNKAKAARLLGISRVTLYRKLAASLADTEGA